MQSLGRNTHIQHVCNIKYRRRMQFRHGIPISLPPANLCDFVSRKKASLCWCGSSRDTVAVNDLNNDASVVDLILLVNPGLAVVLCEEGWRMCHTKAYDAHAGWVGRGAACPCLWLWPPLEVEALEDVVVDEGFEELSEIYSIQEGNEASPAALSMHSWPALTCRVVVVGYVAHNTQRAHCQQTCCGRRKRSSTPSAAPARDCRCCTVPPDHSSPTPC